MTAPRWDMLIRRGSVLDGLGAPAVRVDVGCLDGAAHLLEPGRAGRGEVEIDAAGAFVAPGFIDVHGHSDFASLIWPEAISRAAAGVTTECTGNCGYGAFPLAGEVLARRRAEYAPDALTIDWRDVRGYFERASRTGCAIHRATLIGHGNVRGCVIGYGDRRATAGQIDRMCAIVDEAMAAGCVGLSSGLIYAPGMWADADELTALAKVVAGYNGVVASHIRSEGAELLEAVDEFIAVCRRSGCRGQLSHVKVSGPANWTKMAPLRRRLHAARAEGIALHADRYPYLASRTDLATIVLPRAAMVGSTDAILARLADAPTRATLRRTIERQQGEHLSRWLEGVRVAAVGEPGLGACVGKNLLQLPAVMGESDPLTAAFKLIHDDRTLTQAINFSMTEANLREIYSWDFVAVGSDSSLRNHLGAPEAELPHPRAYGSPARFLESVVRRWKLMDWPEAVRRMTSLPAAILGLADRGVLRNGAAADIVIFDDARIADAADYDAPCRAPEGVRATIVNGRVVWRDGKHTGALPGTLLKRG